MNCSKQTSNTALISLVVALLGIEQISAASMSPITSMGSVAQFDREGKLSRPTGYREWVFIGAPLTPNDMNDGKAVFPEFHNVYIDPASLEPLEKNRRVSRWDSDRERAGQCGWQTDPQRERLLPG